MSKDLQNYLDECGNVSCWPAKKAYQNEVLAYLVEYFDFDTVYTENEVNDIIKQHHTFLDWPLLRRELVEGGFLLRDRGGYEYRRIK